MSKESLGILFGDYLLTPTQKKSGASRLVIGKELCRGKFVFCVVRIQQRVLTGRGITRYGNSKGGYYTADGAPSYAVIRFHVDTREVEELSHHTFKSDAMRAQRIAAMQ